jgi:hypothetical protein
MSWLSVIKRGRNRSANKIQSSELEPVIPSHVPPYSWQYVYIRYTLAHLLVEFLVFYFELSLMLAPHRQYHMKLTLF